MTSMPGYYLRKYVLEQQDEEIIVEEIIPVKYTTYEVTSFCYIFSGCFHDCISCIFNFDDLLYIYFMDQHYRPSKHPDLIRILPIWG